MTMTTMLFRLAYLTPVIVLLLLGVGTELAVADDEWLSPVGIQKNEFLSVTEDAVATGMVSRNRKQNLTLYHINPATYPDDPVNMNLADLNGALFFDLYEIFQTFWCTDKDPSAPAPPPSRCNNPEYDADTEIAVTQLVIEASPPPNSRKLLGPYARCNICDKGASPFVPAHKCHDGEYVCDCFGGFFLYRHWKKCDNPRVGRQRLYYYTQQQREEYMQQYHESYTNDISATTSGDPPPDMEWAKSIMASVNAAKRTLGYWYSTLDIGHGITWRTVQVVKKVSKKCHASSFVAAVKHYSRINSRQKEYEVDLEICLSQNCGIGPDDPDGHSLPTNATSCWAECLAEATLGPNATSYNATGSYGGIARNQLLEAWSRPFRSNDPNLGGCPDIREQLIETASSNPLPPAPTELSRTTSALGGKIS